MLARVWLAGKVSVVLASSGFVLAAGVVPAQANAHGTADAHGRTIAVVDAAINRLRLPVGKDAGEGIDVAAGGNTSATFRGQRGTLAMKAPTSGGGTVTGEGAVFDAPGGEAAVVVQTTSAGGLRALVDIDSAAAPERYAFQLGGDVASLQLDATGGVTAMDSKGVRIAYAAAPWAVDAAGARVPTHFEVHGNTLYEVVLHRSQGFKYGIVADPWWNPFSWSWGQWFSVAKSALASAFTKCGIGALKGTFGLGVATGTTNVMIEKFSSTLSKVKVGGVWGYVGAAAAGCVLANA